MPKEIESTEFVGLEIRAVIRDRETRGYGESAGIFVAGQWKTVPDGTHRKFHARYIEICGTCSSGVACLEYSEEEVQALPLQASVLPEDQMTIPGLVSRIEELEKLLGQTRSCATCCSDFYNDSYPYGPCQGCSGTILKPNWSPNYGTP